MKDAPDVPFWRRQTTRLTAIYLAVIMALSLGFSSILYFVSAAQLERQVPGDYFSDEGGQFLPAARVQRYLSSQVDAGKRELVVRLAVLNTVMLLFGAAISYILARKTLEPIERNDEAQTQFVSDVSHELRTPLTALQATNEVALRKKKLTIQEARQIIQSNIDDVGRMQRMTTLLLSLLSDHAALTRQTIGIHDIVSRAITTIAPQALERDIALDDTTKNLQVDVDPDAIAQVLVVLLDNAIKYSALGSTVTLSTTPKRQMVALTVADTGQGIAPEDQERIFRRFYRSDAARSRASGDGYGLGLTIAQKIVTAHGGTIELRSQLSKGSQFSLLLPLAKFKKSKSHEVKKS